MTEWKYKEHITKDTPSIITYPCPKEIIDLLAPVEIPEINEETLKEEDDEMV